MDEIDKKLLNIIQADFPLEARPFAALGGKIDISQEEVINRIEALKRGGVIRQINAIFDSRALGFTSTLVAMKFPPERLDEAASVINRHPGVSHNYARYHPFNLWFTITLPPGEDLEATVNKLAQEAGAEHTLILPVIRLFKIGVKLDVERGAGVKREEAPRRTQPRDTGLTPEDYRAIGQLEKDIPLIDRPFKLLAQEIGMEEEALLNKAHKFLAEGKMRRYAAVLNHRQAGFRANAMGVWRVPEDRVEEVGRMMASFTAVSHCYQRPSFPEFPYNLYTMVHGRNVRECQSVLTAISEETGITEYIPLYSTKEYKKVRVKYYQPGTSGAVDEG